MNRNLLRTSGGIGASISAGVNGRNNFGVGSLSDEEDLYSGYNDFPSALNTEDLEYDENFQNSARTLESRRPTAIPPRGTTPGSALNNRLGTAAGFTRQSTARTGMFTRGGTARPITGIGGESGGLNRPMTAVRGAGYTTAAGKGQSIFDPMNPGNKSATPSIEMKVEDTPDEKIKQLEDKITNLVEESVLTGCKGDLKKALELAKDASNKEKSLMRLKEQAGANEGHDWDITFSVHFNLATQFEACEMYTEALSTYHAISKNKSLVHGAKVKINMGNIYFKQNNPTKAIKMYRMAMDQLNNTNKDLRLKLMHNMGIILLRIGHPTDASSSFEYIMQEKRSFKTGLHLVLANFMAGEKEKMKKSFQDLLEVPLDTDEDDDKYTTLSDDPVSQLLVEVLKNDKLRKLEKERKLYAERCVLSAARLIAPVVESTFAEGYHWVTEVIKSSKHASLAHALEISKALVFLKQRDLNEAVDILKSFEKKETKVATAAATNLSFMFFLQGETEQAEKYGHMATKADFYNSAAYVNRGNCYFVQQDLEQAKTCYLEGLQSDSSCTEALYNLGVVNQQMKFYEEALEYFHKVQSLVRNHPHVTFQLGKTHELMGETEIAMEWYLKALALAPTDPGILKKLGNLCDAEDDRQQAHQYYYDCYKYDPSDLEIIQWLAKYFKEMQLPEKAVGFYQKAVALQPEETKWQMLMGDCHKRSGNYTQAIECFSRVYKMNPDNITALEALFRISSDMGLKEASIYGEELKKLQRGQESRMNSSTSRFGPPSRMGSGRPGPSKGRSMDRDDSGHYSAKSMRNSRQYGGDSRNNIYDEDDNYHNDDGEFSEDFTEQLPTRLQTAGIRGRSRDPNSNIDDDEDDVIFGEDDGLDLFPLK